MRLTKETVLANSAMNHRLTHTMTKTPILLAALLHVATAAHGGNWALQP
ncbi:MAG: hypothetical protein ACI8W8_004580, partial [Rhodothermales bacterium]